MHFSTALIPLLALVSTMHAFVMIQTCNGTDTGGPCVNWSGTLTNGVPSACFNLADMGQDNIVSSVTLTFDVACTLYTDPGCTGSSINVKQTFLNLADVGFDNVVSSFRYPTTVDRQLFSHVQNGDSKKVEKINNYFRRSRTNCREGGLTRWIYSPVGANTLSFKSSGTVHVYKRGPDYCFAFGNVKDSYIALNQVKVRNAIGEQQHQAKEFHWHSMRQRLQVAAWHLIKHLSLSLFLAPMSAGFPDELWLRILGELRDKQTLKSVTLSSKRLYSVGMEILFRDWENFGPETTQMQEEFWHGEAKMCKLMQFLTVSFILKEACHSPFVHMRGLVGLSKLTLAHLELTVEFYETLPLLLKLSHLSMRGSIVPIAPSSTPSPIGVTNLSISMLYAYMEDRPKSPNFLHILPFLDTLTVDCFEMNDFPPGSAERLISLTFKPLQANEKAVRDITALIERASQLHHLHVEFHTVLRPTPHGRDRHRTYGALITTPPRPLEHLRTISVPWVLAEKLITALPGLVHLTINDRIPSLANVLSFLNTTTSFWDLGETLALIPALHTVHIHRRSETKLMFTMAGEARMREQTRDYAVSCQWATANLKLSCVKLTPGSRVWLTPGSRAWLRMPGPSWEYVRTAGRSLKREAKLEFPHKLRFEI
ncbi:hypothetical protein DFH08DRAFT_809026 [Mycena albidolilacea]|uniref:F-box domain-containing protein n=1 Tax=Mycena albidolilacea TaxID=1033008 RepID=A0AAD7A0S5_9AGAR|nr:hypothetical protein DFH08DRAFT_809026 [Mycena albidolilacea]